MGIRQYIAFMMLACMGMVVPVASVVADEARKISDYPVLEKLRGKDESLAYDYLGEKYGMDAWLLSGPELMQIVYVLPQDKSAIVGGTLVTEEGQEANSALLQRFMKANPERAAEILQEVRKEAGGDAANIVQNGQEVSGDHAQEKTPAKMTRSEKFWHDLSAIGAVPFGTDAHAPEIFAVLDPVQTDTKLVWNVLMPLAEKGYLRLNIVPLAASSADSIMDVAYILGSDDPAQSWTDLMNGDKPDMSGTPETHGVLRMKSIVDMAQALNLRQLPLLVYRSAGAQENSGAVRIIRGTPKDWVALFRDIGMAEYAASTVVPVEAE